MRAGSLWVLLIISPFLTFSQAEIKVTQPGVSINNSGDNTPHPSAVLDVDSRTKGALFPRMTSAERDAIPNPAAGLLVFNKDLCVYEYFNGVEWTSFGQPPTLQDPGTPTNFQAYYTSADEVSLSWDDPGAIETGFVIERATNASFTTDLTIIELSSNTITYEDQVPSSGVYHYRVKAVNACQAGSAASLQIAPPFISTWETASSSETITLPLSTSITYNIVVDWGDGSPAQTITSWDQATHSYTNAGQYIVTISGVLQGWRFNNGGDRLKIVDISQWGRFCPTADGVFYGCANLNVSATDVPDLSHTTTLSRFFTNCTSLVFNASVNDWDVSTIEAMDNMFMQVPFNEDLDQWDVSSCTNFSEMFRNATAFNRDISGWDVSACTNMNSMFDGATAFNNLDQSLSTWGNKTSQVTTMINMFRNASAFNVPIDQWDVSAVTSMLGMFNNASNFNQPLNNWGIKTSAVTTMAGMFQGAASFDQDISGWVVSGCTSMKNMFMGATDFGSTTFPSTLNNWERTGSTVGNVEDMSGMFRGAIAFDQPLGNWNVSSVTSFAEMFMAASVFNQPLNDWMVTSSSSFRDMFRASGFNRPLDAWHDRLIGQNIVMYGMFNACPFNQDIGAWNTTNVVDMSRMFHANTAFDQDIGSWDTSNCLLFFWMFNGATAFNQDLGGWSPANLLSQGGTDMFKNATAMTSTNFDSLLIGWAQAPTIASGVTLVGPPAGHSGSQDVLDAIADLEGPPNNWTIN